MNTRPEREGTLRLGRLELSRLAWALLISLCLHLGGYGTFKLGEYFDFWKRVHLPSWLEKTAMLPPPLEQTNSPPEQDPQLTFVDVNPEAATPEPPKDTPFYSDKNSLAANPEADKESTVPKITGEQTDIVKAEDVPRSKLDKLQPAFPPATPEPAPEQSKPKSTAPPGDLAMAKPADASQPDNGTAEQSRPRTIREALQRQNRNQLVGQKMKQDGGVSRTLQLTALDAKATAFGSYDAAFIEAVQQRWYDLLDTMSYDGYRHGKVVLKFRLNYDGRITDLQILENNVGDTLGLKCWQAVSDPSPFERWPRDMRLAINKDYRELQFAFFYN